MNFLAPAAFGLLALLPVIIAMYLLKLRREEQVVPSVYLWQRMVREMEANAPWQRLRRNLLLLLQLLFLIFLIFALARPFTYEEGPSGQLLILIIDTSASMAAADPAPTRLEAAKDQARRLAADLPDDARVTVVAAGPRARVLVPSSQDRRQVYNAIESLQPEMGGSDLVTALQLASAIASREREADVVVLSDGGVTLPDRLNLQGRITYLPIGASDANQAVSLVTLDPAPGGDTLSALVQVSNYAGVAVSRRLLISVDGALLNAYDLDLPAQGQQAVVIDGLPLETGALEARLASAGATDVLALDDQAWAVYESGAPAQVLLISDGSRFLETALSLFPGIQAVQASPAQAAALTFTASGVPTANTPDLVILDAYAPLTDTLPVDPTLLPGDLLFVGPYTSTAYFSVAGLIEYPDKIPADPAALLLKDVDFSEVTIYDSAAIPLPAWADPLVYADNAEQFPLIFTGETGGKQVSVLAFDLRHSDLPLNVAFPLLLGNLLRWHLPQLNTPGSGLVGGVRIGDMVEIPALLDAADTVEVTAPDGRTTRLSFEAPAQPGAARAARFTGTDAPGVYTVRWDAERASQFVVNVYLPEESNVRPAVSLGIESPETTLVHDDDEANMAARREWWRPLAWLALALLVAEWLAYHRGTLGGLWKTAAFQRARRQAAPMKK